MNEQTVQDFKKYRERGDYHWRETLGHWRRRSPIARARYGIMLRLLRKHFDLRGKVALDVGCGDGVMLHMLARNGAQAIGTDADFAGLAIGAGVLKKRGTSCPLTHASCFDMPIRTASVDVITCSEVIEHLSTPDAFLSEAARILKPGGVLCITTPVANGIEFRDPYHVHEYRTADLQDLLAGYFSQPFVSGYCDTRLMSLYSNADRPRILNRMYAAAFKSADLLGINPFLWTGPDTSCDGLVAVCVR